MTNRPISRPHAVAVVSAALAIGAGALGSGASAQHPQTVLVKLPDGRVVRVPVDPNSGTPLVSLAALAQGGGPATASAGQGQTASTSTSSTSTPSSPGGGPQKRSQKRRGSPKPKPKPAAPSPQPSSPRPAPNPIRKPNGTPTTQNPTFFNALPAPSNSSRVPNFLISHFRVPVFLLPIYQAAGNQYGIPWEVLAAINEIETDYGRNLSVSTAGAVGWMQFLPSTWKRWGVDANSDGKKDPYNPADAIFAAARYLNAAGGGKHIRQAIFAYNHAAWYVDSVMLRAKLIAGVPEPLIGSLTGLTEGRFPVAGRARYADDALERQARAHNSPLKGHATDLASDRGDQNSINIFTKGNAPVVATTDGVIKKIGNDRDRGNYIVLQDAYGNQYTYSGLGSVAAVYPVPKDEATFFGVEVIAAHREKAPRSAATAGRQLPGSPGATASTATVPADGSHPRVVYRKRLFAHPSRPNAVAAGSIAQLFDESGGIFGFSNYDSRFAGVLGLNSHNAAAGRLARHLGHAPRTGREHRARQGAAPQLPDPARRQEGPDDRSEADTRRVEAARDDGRARQTRPERAERHTVDRPDPAHAEVGARAPRALGPAREAAVPRQGRHQDPPDRPQGARGARVPL